MKNRKFLSILLTLPILALACSQSKTSSTPGNFRLGQFRTAADCNEVENFVREFARRAEQNPGGVIPLSGNGTGVPLLPAAEAPTSGTQTTTDSSSNSVSQSDIAFSDGNRGLLYVFDSQKNLRIYRASPSAAIALRSTAPLGFQPAELITVNAGSQNYAVVFGGNESLAVPLPDTPAVSDSPGMAPPSKPETVIALFDVTDETRPVELKRETFPGFFLEARALTNQATVLWVITNPIPIYLENLGSKDIFPQKTLQSGSTLSSAPIAPCERIYLYQNEGLDEGYAPSSLTETIVSLLNLGDPSLTVNSQPILSPAWSSVMAANTEHLFLGQNVGTWDTQETELFQFKIETNAIALNASGTVPGQILNQFFIDEKNGTVRVFHHQGGVGGCVNCVVEPELAAPGSGSGVSAQALERGNYLSTYRQEGDRLNLKGRTGPFEADESPYAARFLGNLGCIITFRQIDPLTCFDLSNPAQPTPLGELQIQGVSFHLEPVTPQLLLGIGQGAAPGTVVANLFDISNPAQPLLAAQSPLSEGSSWATSSVFYDYRALGKDSSQRNFAVPVDGDGGSSLVLIAVDPDARQILKKGSLVKPTSMDGNYESFQRAFFFGETVATLSTKQVEVYLWDTLLKLFASPLSP